MHYGVAVGKAEPLNKVKALPEVVEGSSEDEEELDRELVEKKVQALLGQFSHCSLLPWPGAYGDWGHFWMLTGAEASLVAPGSWGHHQALTGAGVIAGCLRGPGALPYTHMGWDIARCLQGPGALSGACRTWESH